MMFVRASGQVGGIVTECGGMVNESWRNAMVWRGWSPRGIRAWRSIRAGCDDLPLEEIGESFLTLLRGWERGPDGRSQRDCVGAAPRDEAVRV
jgi:hypothetical protein